MEYQSCGEWEELVEDGPDARMSAPSINFQTDGTNEMRRRRDENVTKQQVKKGRLVCIVRGLLSITPFSPPSNFRRHPDFRNHHAITSPSSTFRFSFALIRSSQTPSFIYQGRAWIIVGGAKSCANDQRVWCGMIWIALY